MDSCPGIWFRRQSGEDCLGQILGEAWGKASWWPRNVGQGKQSEGRDRTMITMGNTFHNFPKGILCRMESQSRAEYKIRGLGWCLPWSQLCVSRIKQDFKWYLLTDWLGKSHRSGSNPGSASWTDDLVSLGRHVCRMGTTVAVWQDWLSSTSGVRWLGV